MELDRRELEAKYSGWTNDDLLAAKYLNSGDYTPIAREIIDQVLRKRNIPSERNSQLSCNLILQTRAIIN